MGNRKKRERGPLTPKRQATTVPPQVLLHMFAVEIEAAGSIERAQKLGVIGLDGANRRVLSSIVPKTRGGSLEGPDVEQDWSALVLSLLKDREYDIDELRRRYDRLARGGDEAEVG